MEKAQFQIKNRISKLQNRERKLLQNINVMKKLLLAGRLKKEFAEKAIQSQEESLSKGQTELKQLRAELEERTKGLLTYNPFKKLVEKMK